MDPIAQAAAGTQASQSDWTAVKASAGAGELFFEPEAAEECAKACEDAIGKIEDHLWQVRQLTFVDGFGSPARGSNWPASSARKRMKHMQFCWRTNRCWPTCATLIVRRLRHMWTRMWVTAVSSVMSVDRGGPAGLRCRSWRLRGGGVCCVQ